MVTRVRAPARFGQVHLRHPVQLSLRASEAQGTLVSHGIVYVIMGYVGRSTKRGNHDSAGSPSYCAPLLWQYQH